MSPNYAKYEKRQKWLKITGIALWNLFLLVAFVAIVISLWGEG